MQGAPSVTLRACPERSERGKLRDVPARYSVAARKRGNLYYILNSMIEIAAPPDYIGMARNDDG